MGEKLENSIENRNSIKVNIDLVNRTLRFGEDSQSITSDDTFMDCRMWELAFRKKFLILEYDLSSIDPIEEFDMNLEFSKVYSYIKENEVLGVGKPLYALSLLDERTSIPHIRVFGNMSLEVKR